MNKTDADVQGWVTVSCRFWVSSDSQALFDEAVARIPREVWMDITSGSGFSVQSEAATKPRRKGK